MIAEFQFLRPAWLAALLALPLFWFALRADGALQRSWARAVDAHLLRHLLAGSAATRRWPARPGKNCRRRCTATRPRA